MKKCRTFKAGRNLGNLEIEGEILINGENAGTSMSKVSAYVQVKTVFHASYMAYVLYSKPLFPKIGQFSKMTYLLDQ